MQKQFLGVTALSAALAVTDVSPAQAVQWRVEDGGNGHWYLVTAAPFPNWASARAAAEAAGGHLATIGSAAEWQFVRPRGVGCYVGGYQDPTANGWSEPAGGWRWVTDEPWSIGPWSGFAPDDAPCHVTAGDGTQDVLWISFQSNGILDDIEATPVPYCQYSLSKPAVLEWSADCNSDGIVDYGQILSGQLADSDNDGIPNVCECTCDVFRDRMVNGIDLGILLGQWGPVNQYTVTDFNGDGAVDGSDLGALLAAWGPCPG